MDSSGIDGKTESIRGFGMADLLKDANGHTSSKRVAGFSGLIVMTLISGYAIWKDPSQVGNIIWPWAIMVGGLLGVTVLEKK